MLTLVTCLCCLVQEFSSDMGSRGVKRIADVSRLRISQFSQVEIQNLPLKIWFKPVLCFLSGVFSISIC
jgi:hypothetical protein